MANFHPFSVIMQKEGGDAAAFKATMNYIAAAGLMQRNGQKFRNKDWCRWNNMTKRVEWLYVTEDFRGSMQTQYELVLEEHQRRQDGSRPAALAPSAVNSPTPKKQATGDEDASKSTDPANGSGNAGSPNPQPVIGTSPDPKGGKQAPNEVPKKSGKKNTPPSVEKVPKPTKEAVKEMNTYVRQLVELKRSLAEVTSEAADLLPLIANNGSWNGQTIQLCWSLSDRRGRPLKQGNPETISGSCGRTTPSSP